MDGFMIHMALDMSTITSIHLVPVFTVLVLHAVSAVNSALSETAVEVIDPLSHGGKLHAAPSISRRDIEPCLRGRCLDGRCPETDRERCPEDECEERYRRCNGTLLCVKDRFENCPGEPCTPHQRVCADGSCLHRSRGTCSDGSEACVYLEKRCANGLCYDSLDRCPEEPCGFRCDGTCHDESIRCDGNKDCSSREDEQDCPFFSKANKHLLWLLLVIPALIFGIVYGYCRWGGQNARSSNEGSRAVYISPLEQNPETYTGVDDHWDA